MKEIYFYPFGMQMPNRKYAATNLYRYGFNGKENDNEVKGEGNEQDYGMRFYDPRVGRFLSADPISDEYPWYTPYQFAGNTPIQAIDLDGLEPAYAGFDKNRIWVSSPIAGDNLPRRVPDSERHLLPKATCNGCGENVSLMLDLVPGLGQLKALYESATGEDAITGEELSTFQQATNILPFRKIQKTVKAVTAVTVVRATNKAAEVKKVTKSANKVDDVAANKKAIVKDEAIKTEKNASNDVIHVTEDGVAIPKGNKYKIPSNYVENPNRKGSYGVIDAKGKFEEKLRIDPATPPGKQGPNYSHYHKNGKKEHLSPNPKDKDPGFNN